MEDNARRQILNQCKAATAYLIKPLDQTFRLLSDSALQSPFHNLVYILLLVLLRHRYVLTIWLQFSLRHLNTSNENVHQNFTYDFCSTQLSCCGKKVIKDNMSLIQAGQLNWLKTVSNCWYPFNIDFSLYEGSFVECWCYREFCAFCTYQHLHKRYWQKLQQNKVERNNKFMIYVTIIAIKWEPNQQDLDLTSLPLWWEVIRAHLSKHLLINGKGQVHVQHGNVVVLDPQQALVKLRIQRLQIPQRPRPEQQRKWKSIQSHEFISIYLIGVVLL